MSGVAYGACRIISAHGVRLFYAGIGKLISVIRYRLRKTLTTDPADNVPQKHWQRQYDTDEGAVLGDLISYLKANSVFIWLDLQATCSCNIITAWNTITIE